MPPEIFTPPPPLDALIGLCEVEPLVLNIIKEDETSRTCNMHGRDVKYTQNCGRKSEGQRSLGRHYIDGKHNLKMDTM
jgi:hypothetical protein